jgi:hypothetical protein
LDLVAVDSLHGQGRQDREPRTLTLLSMIP